MWPTSPTIQLIHQLLLLFYSYLKISFNLYFFKFVLLQCVYLFGVLLNNKLTVFSMVIYFNYNCIYRYIYSKLSLTTSVFHHWKNWILTVATWNPCVYIWGKQIDLLKLREEETAALIFISWTDWKRDIEYKPSEIINK